jgi:hypothetical protein
MGQLFQEAQPKEVPISRHSLAGAVSGRGGGEDLDQVPSLGHCKKVDGSSLLVESLEVTGSPFLQDPLNVTNHKVPNAMQGL